MKKSNDDFEAQSRRWKHPHGFDVLKKLGIVERSRASISEGDDDNPHEKNELTKIGDESDEEVVFDRDSLIKGDKETVILRKNKFAQCAKSFRCQTVLLAVIFFISGLCVAIIGPTLPDLQLHTNSRSFDAIVSVVSANAFGIVIGLTFSAACYTMLNPFCIITVALFFCALATLIVPWCTTSLSATFIFIVQGISLGCLEKGAYNLFFTNYKKAYHIMFCFYFSFAFGATLSPLITSSFVANYQMKYSSQVSTLSVSLSSPLLFLDRRTKREVQIDPNATVAFFFNLTDVECLEFNNCTNTTGTLTYIKSTTVSTETPIVQKPKIADATDIDRKPLRGDTNKPVGSNDKDKAINAIPTTTPRIALTTLVKSNLSVINVSIDGNRTTFIPTEQVVNSIQASTKNGMPITTTTLPLTSTSILTPTTTSSVPTTTAANFVKETSTAADLKSRSILLTTVPSLLDAASTADESQFINSSEAPNSTIDPSTEKPFAMLDMPKNMWSYMLKRVDELNNVRVAYLVISTISFSSTLLYIFSCCCSSCQSVRTLPYPEEDENRFQLIHLFRNRVNLHAALLSWTFCFICSGVESVLSNLLTVYAVTGLRQEQGSGVLLTSMFWFFVAVSRIASLVYYKRLCQNNFLSICLAASFVSSGVMVVFSTSWTALCVSVASLGLTIGHFVPIVFAWLDSQLSLAPWFVTIWLCVFQTARAIFAPLTAYGMVNHSPRIMPIVVLVCVVSLSLVTIFMRKMVVQANQLIAAAESGVVTRHLKLSNGTSLEYRQHIDEIDGSDSDED